MLFIAVVLQLAALASAIDVRTARALRAEGGDEAEARAGGGYVYEHASLAKLPVGGFFGSWSPHPHGFTLDVSPNHGVSITSVEVDAQKKGKSYVLEGEPEYPCVFKKCPAAPETCLCVLVNSGGSLKNMVIKADAAGGAVLAKLKADYTAVRQISVHGWPSMGAYLSAVGSPSFEKTSLFKVFWSAAAVNPFSSALPALTSAAKMSGRVLHTYCLGLISAAEGFILETVFTGLVVVALEAPANLPHNDLRLAIAKAVSAAYLPTALPDSPALAAQNTKVLASINALMTILENPARTRDQIIAWAISNLIDGDLQINIPGALKTPLKSACLCTRPPPPAPHSPTRPPLSVNPPPLPPHRPPPSAPRAAAAGWTDKNIAQLRGIIVDGIAGLGSNVGWLPLDISFERYTSLCGAYP